jgi:hypothetical protein
LKPYVDGIEAVTFLSIQGVIEQLACSLTDRSVQKCAGAVHDVIFSVSVRTRLLNIRDRLLAVVTVDGDGVDGADTGSELGIELALSGISRTKTPSSCSSLLASTALPASSSRSNSPHSATHWNIPMQVSRSSSTCIPSIGSGRAKRWRHARWWWTNALNEFV